MSNEANGFLPLGTLPRGPACGFSFVNRTQQRVRDLLCELQLLCMSMMYSLYADLSKRREDTVTPYVIIKLSTTENLCLPKKHVIAFTEKDDIDGEVFEIEQVDTRASHWAPQ